MFQHGALTLHALSSYGLDTPLVLLQENSKLGFPPKFVSIIAAMSGYMLDRHPYLVHSIA